ncbi:hypothetical protein [Peptoniphilus stercorisuis]|nr:hypothetical protein [Peptoniphilus stercorisuis]
MRKFTFKIIFLIIFLIAIMKYIDCRKYVVYDKKDGKVKLEESINNNNKKIDKYKNFTKKIID